MLAKLVFASLVAIIACEHLNNYEYMYKTYTFTTGAKIQLNCSEPCDFYIESELEGKACLWRTYCEYTFHYDNSQYQVMIKFVSHDNNNAIHYKFSYYSASISASKSPLPSRRESSTSNTSSTVSRSLASSNSVSSSKVPTSLSAD